MNQPIETKVKGVEEVEKRTSEDTKMETYELNTSGYFMYNIRTISINFVAHFGLLVSDYIVALAVKSFTKSDLILPIFSIIYTVYFIFCFSFTSFSILFSHSNLFVAIHWEDWALDFFLCVIFVRSHFSFCIWLFSTFLYRFLHGLYFISFLFLTYLLFRYYSWVVFLKSLQ